MGQGLPCPHGGRERLRAPRSWLWVCWYPDTPRAPLPPAALILTVSPSLSFSTLRESLNAAKAKACSYSPLLGRI